MTNIYFHYGGFWAMPHYIGAIKQLYKEYNKPNSRLDRNIKFYGNSAGASWALVCYLVLNGIMEVDQMEIRVNEQFDKPRPLSHILTPIYCDLINIMAPHWSSNLARLLSGVLHIGVTTKDGHKFVNEYKTNADIYHALLCSGTIAGCSNYESILNGETCLDGGYKFKPEHLIKDTIIVANDTDVPLSLTIPDYKTRRILQRKGKRQIKRYFRKERQMPMIINDYSRLYMKCAFWLHEIMEKSPHWKKHLEKMTNSKITS